MRRRQYVFTVAAESLAPVVAAVRTALANQDHSIAACRTLDDGFTEVGGTLNDAAIGLEQGQFCTLQLRPVSGPIEFSLIHRSYGHEGLLSMYSATFEYVAQDWSTLWNELLACPELRVVTVGMEEGVELTDQMLSPESFPWHEWPLIIAALKPPHRGADWLIREGPS